MRINENLRVCMDEGLELLRREQELNGYFRTYTMQPNYGHGMAWMPYEKNGFVTANILIPLTGVNHPLAQQLLDAGYGATLGNKNRYGLWQYFNDTNEPYFIPYETDTASLFSYVARCMKKPENNRNFFLEQINAASHFNLWFLPGYINGWRYPLYKLEVYRNWQKAQKRLAFKNKLVAREDAEFCVSANVLLYLGHTPETDSVVQHLIHIVNNPGSIPLLYYPNEIIACYLFARAALYGKIEAFHRCRDRIAERIFLGLKEPANQDKAIKILAAFTLLVFSFDNAEAQKLYAECVAHKEEINRPFAFYCSNSDIDFNHQTGLHNAYFGAPALTIACYIAFLNLLAEKQDQQKSI